MADKTLFSRLNKLFSTDVIIRNVGGRNLRVADVNKIQTFGNLENNTLVDRYNRLYSSKTLAWNPTQNYQTLRIQLYADYEAMEQDAIIASALDIVASECSLRNEYGETLVIKTKNDKIKKILHNLFYDVMNIEFNLFSWVRMMCKYGDFPLKLDISEKFGVFNVHPLSPYEFIREENYNPENPNEIRFVIDPGALARGVSTLTNSSRREYKNYEVAHFRLITDSNFLPYGRSYVEPGRKVFKQLTLMEDAMLIHRIMRAPEKRTFFINVGSIPPNEVDNFMEKTINKLKKVPYVDPATGEYNLKFNMQNMTEDFFIPVRGNDATTRIDTAKGLDYDGITDVVYLREKLLASLKIPKAFLGYDDKLQGKSTLAAEDIRFARTVEQIQKIIVSELTKIALVHLYVQGFDGADLTDFELKLTNPSIVFEQEQIALYKEKVSLANDILEKKLLSSDFLYQKIFNLSEDEYQTERNRALEDAQRTFRINQIETEGNDPFESGTSYGTPHDLASLYSNKRKGGEIPSVLPVGYDEKKPGRPPRDGSDYNTEKSNFGRDVSGADGMREKDPTGDVKLDKKPLSLEHLRVLETLQNDKKDNPVLLNEENILND
jgi:hypothetical protein